MPGPARRTAGSPRSPRRTRPSSSKHAPRPGALVQAAEDTRDRAVTEAEGRRQDAQEAAQRAATAETRAEDARAEDARVREDAARELAELRASTTAELDRLRVDSARERDELRQLLDDRARVLTEARDELRQRAERDLDAARSGRARPTPPGTATADAPTAARRRRSGQE
jgi:hypothetical protein